MPDEVTVNHTVQLDVSEMSFHDLVDRLSQCRDRVRPDAKIRLLSSGHITFFWESTVPEASDEA